MAFGNNSNLYTVANQVFINVDAADDLAKNDVYTGTSGPDVFIFADGNVGDETLFFDKNDSIVTHKKIYDSNDDGYIWFGDNGILDIDRTSKKNAGADQITLLGEADGLRFLGSKETQTDKTGVVDYVYADAYTRLKLQSAKGTVTEGTVGNDALNAAGGNKIFLYDTALGLNLGADTITGFGAGDRLVTTTEIFDSNGDGIITFGKNKVLDLAAGEAPSPLVEGADVGPGGQIAFDGGLTKLTVAGSEVIADVTYYYYTI